MFRRSLKGILFILFCTLGMTVFAETGAVLHDSEGRPINMSALKGKWIVVNYWAEWCQSCLEEIPELNKFHKNNKNKDIIILGVNYDQLSVPYLAQSMRNIGIRFPVLLEDPKLIWHLDDITMLPTTFVINPQGDVVKKVIGPNTEQSLLKVVQNRLAAKKKPKTSTVG